VFVHAASCACLIENRKTGSACLCLLAILYNDKAFGSVIFLKIFLSELPLAKIARLKQEKEVRE
jgi:hypothetical protein